MHDIDTPTPTAVLCIYLPAAEKVIHHVFTTQRHVDPLGAALSWRRSEEPNDDFPDSIWGVISNEAAQDIHRRHKLGAMLGEDPDSDAIRAAFT